MTFFKQFVCKNLNRAIVEIVVDVVKSHRQLKKTIIAKKITNTQQQQQIIVATIAFLCILFYIIQISIQYNNVNVMQIVKFFANFVYIEFNEITIFKFNKVVENRNIVQHVRKIII